MCTMCVLCAGCLYFLRFLRCMLYVSRYLLLYEQVIERICRARHYIVLIGRTALNLHQILFDVRLIDKQVNLK